MNKTKHGAPKGNANARRGDVSATSMLQMRCTPAQKAAWVRAAQAENMKLTEWVVKKLDC